MRWHWLLFQIFPSARPVVKSCLGRGQYSDFVFPGEMFTIYEPNYRSTIGICFPRSEPCGSERPSRRRVFTKVMTASHWSPSLDSEGQGVNIALNVPLALHSPHLYSPCLAIFPFRHIELLGSTLHCFIYIVSCGLTGPLTHPSWASLTAAFQPPPPSWAETLNSMDQEKCIDSRLIITTSYLIGLALVFLLLRVLGRVLKRCDIGWDDFTLIASWVGLSPYC